MQAVKERIEEGAEKKHLLLLPSKEERSLRRELVLF